MRVLCMSVSSRSCSADSNARTEMICIFLFLGLLVLTRAEYLLHKGQNITREAECSHCHHSGCYLMTVSIHFWTSSRNYCSFSTSSACLFPMLWMIFFSQLFWLCFLQHTACLSNAVIALLKVPLSFQRYFFQKLQSTSIKVSTAQMWPKTSLYRVFTSWEKPYRRHKASAFLVKILNCK